jgi:ribonuclease III
LREEILEKIYRHLGYRFKDLSLLRCALTHRSVSGSVLENNERLEFLGDALLNVMIAELLFHKFPRAKEGDLSRLRAHLVSGATLAEISLSLNLGSYILLGVGELRSGGFNRESILADALEAMIAAIYLDSGMGACVECITRWFGGRIDSVDFKPTKDAKTQLQEYLQSHKFSLPKYHVVHLEGDAHEQLFKVECWVDGLEMKTTGEGTSRRRAEQKAAEYFLKILKDLYVKS